MDDLYSGKLLDDNRDLIGKLEVGGYSAKRISEYAFEVREIEVAGQNATLVRCSYDPILISRPDPTGGPDQVFSDKIESRIAKVRMSQDDNGKWRSVGAEVLQSVVGGESLCD